ncbi:MAG: erythromycin esterase family protein [Gammaproteobacteria bacterium]|nr:erythromycin esterase family protein [Gammaproteobacteria bacterium]
MNSYHKLVDIISNKATPLKNNPHDYDKLIDKIGDSRFVLLGEATHGSHEFYQARADITERLIKEKGFMAIAIEGDFPDTYRVHNYLQGQGDQREWEQALSGFKRFPNWMWRNTTILPFITWLRQHNDDLPKKEKVGLYGLDLYSLQSSSKSVIRYLQQRDPEAAKRAKQRYSHFNHGTPAQTYGYLVNNGLRKSCAKEVDEQLLELQCHSQRYLASGSFIDKERYFYAIQNARLIKNAERYYRAVFESNVSSWNLRDHHMAETFNALAAHLAERYNKPAKIVVWAHNSHLGDARATEMSERGEVNLGQLLREQYGAAVYSVGFSTYSGTVTAASEWDCPPECKEVKPGLPGSYEQLFHLVQQASFIVDLDDPELEKMLCYPRLQRAIGVIYSPGTERSSHYYFSRLAYQFNSLIHFDETTAVVPLEVTVNWEKEDLSETYPSGI